MVTTRMETTCDLTYSMSKAIHGNLSMQFVFVLPDSQFLSLDSDLFWLQQWGPVAHAKKDGTAFIYPCHLHMTCSVGWTSLCAACFSYIGLTHSSCVVHVCTLCDILWPEVQSHFDNSHMHASQASSTMSCIHLVKVGILEE